MKLHWVKYRSPAVVVMWCAHELNCVVTYLAFARQDVVCLFFMSDLKSLTLFSVVWADGFHILLHPLIIVNPFRSLDRHSIALCAVEIYSSSCPLGIVGLGTMGLFIG